MYKKIILVFVAVFCQFYLLAQSNSAISQDSLRYRATLILKGGAFKRLYVKGTAYIGNSGINFTPDSIFSSPRQSRIFANNHLIERIFIPYSNVSEIKSSIIFSLLIFPVAVPTVITNDERKYLLTLQHCKKCPDFVTELKRRIQK